LREELQRNSDLAGFLADQGLEDYTKVLQRRGFKNISDLSKLEEADIDFKVKPVHKTRLLWVATTQKMFLEEDGKALPDVDKVKADPKDDPVPERKTPMAKRPPPKKKAPPGKGKKAAPAKKAAPTKKAPPREPTKLRRRKRGRRRWNRPSQNQCRTKTQSSRTTITRSSRATWSASSFLPSLLA
jgi:outer membrane biosynthesis protein TonB